MLNAEGLLISCGGGGDSTTAYVPELPINDADLYL